MDVLTLASICGAGVDPVTTAAVIRLESGFDPLVIRDNTLQVTLHPATSAIAEAMVMALVRKNHRLAIGLMQVTTPWAVRFHLRASDLVEACTNVRVGTWILAENYRVCGNQRSPKAALECALSAYWSGNGSTGGVYVNALYAQARSPYRMAETAGVTDGLLGSGRGGAPLARVSAHGFDFVAPRR